MSTEEVHGYEHEPLELDDAMRCLTRARGHLLDRAYDVPEESFNLDAAYRFLWAIQMTLVSDQKVNVEVILADIGIRPRQ